MEETARKKIIVPWDFNDQEAKFPLLHAYQLAQVRGDDIILLASLKRPGLFGSKEEFTSQHVQLVKRISDVASQYTESLNQEFEAALQEQQHSRDEVVAEEDAEHESSNTAVREHSHVDITGEVLVYSNLQNDFRDFYYTHNANLVVTRQFLLNNEQKKLVDMVDFLLKVKASRVEGIPFIIANKAPSHVYYTDLVVPVTTQRTFRETVRWIIQIANYYHCNVNLIRPPAISDSLQKFNLATNISFIKKFLEEQDIIYGLKTGSRKIKFEDSVFEFMQNIDADILILMSDQYTTYFPNKKINIDTPVMLINPLQKKFQSFY